MNRAPGSGHFREIHSRLPCDHDDCPLTRCLHTSPSSHRSHGSFLKIVLAWYLFIAAFCILALGLGALFAMLPLSLCLFFGLHLALGIYSGYWLLTRP